MYGTPLELALLDPTAFYPAASANDEQPAIFRTNSQPQPQFLFGREYSERGEALAWSQSGTTLFAERGAAEENIRAYGATSNVLKSSERVTVVPSTLASEEAGMP